MRMMTFCAVRMRRERACRLTVLLASVLLASVVSALDYAVVERLGSGCPRLDSCVHFRSSGQRRLDTVQERNCACDHLCAEYGDCCVDAPSGDDDASRRDDSAPDRPKCFDLKQFGGVYMRDRCPPTYRGPDEVRRLCEEGPGGERNDPLGSMPVTDSTTGLTYRNHYCSMCDERTDDPVLWTPRLECPLLTLFNRSGAALTDEYVIENLATDGRGWGLYLENGDNGSLFFHDCDVDPVMPRALEGKIRLCRPGLVSECAPWWPDDEARRLCASYAGARYLHGGDGYRNAHCALCNGVNVTRLSCQSAELRGFDIFRSFGTHSFALLLDIHEGRGQRVGQVRRCGDGEVFDPFFKKCRSLTCLPGYVREGRACVQKQPAQQTPPLPTESAPVSAVSVHGDTVEEGRGDEDNSTSANVTSHEPDSPAVSLSSGAESHNVSSADDVAVGQFLDCLLISLTDEDYVLLPNGTLFVPRYDRLYEPTSYRAADGSVLVCAPFDPGEEGQEGAKFPPLLGHVTVVCLGVSMFFLLLHAAAFCAVPDLRNLSGRNLLSQCSALFLAYLCFVVGQFESLGGHAPSCSLVAFLTFYFFQASFFWMAAMAFDVWRTLRMATTQLRVSGGRQVGRFCAYSLFAWTTPLLLLLLLASAEYADLLPPAYRPDFGSGGPPCWFKRRRSLLVFFAAPLFAIMLANIVLFAASARMIVMTTSATQQAGQLQQRRNFSLYLRLALLMGLTWAVGLVAGGADVPFLFYLFVVLNALQGLFVFVAFTCTSKVIGHLRSLRWWSGLRGSSRPAEFKSSGISAASSVFSTKPTATLVIRN